KGIARRHHGRSGRGRVQDGNVVDLGRRIDHEPPVWPDLRLPLVALRARAPGIADEISPLFSEILVETLIRLIRRRNEDEPSPDLGRATLRTEPGLVEVEEAFLVSDCRDLAFEVIAPAVKPADEGTRLPAVSMLDGVAAMRADVVEA